MEKLQHAALLWEIWSSLPKKFTYEYFLLLTLSTIFLLAFCRFAVILHVLKRVSCRIIRRAKWASIEKKFSVSGYALQSFSGLAHMLGQGWAVSNAAESFQTRLGCCRAGLTSPTFQPMGLYLFTSAIFLCRKCEPCAKGKDKQFQEKKFTVMSLYQVLKVQRVEQQTSTLDTTFQANVSTRPGSG